MISMIMVLNQKGDIMISRQYRYVHTRLRSTVYSETVRGILIGQRLISLLLLFLLTEMTLDGQLQTLFDSRYVLRQLCFFEETLAYLQWYLLLYHAGNVVVLFHLRQDI
jgi:hypothetical protein